MKKLILAAALISGSAMASWEHTSRVDLMTDQDTSFIGSAASQGSGLFAVRCDNKDFDIIVSFREYMGDKYETLAVRFGDNEAFNISASASTNGQAFFVSSPEKADFIAQMKASKRLVVRGTDFRGTPKTFAMDLTGFTAAANKLACLK